MNEFENIDNKSEEDKETIFNNKKKFIFVKIDEIEEFNKYC
jgi:hypothetical protein